VVIINIFLNIGIQLSGMHHARSFFRTCWSVCNTKSSSRM